LLLQYRLKLVASIPHQRPLYSKSLSLWTGDNRYEAKLTINSSKSLTCIISFPVSYQLMTFFGRFATIVA